MNVSDRWIYSLDVCSLFTNVTLKETIEYIENYIENSGTYVGLWVDKLKRLIYNIQSQIDGCICRQKDGIAMESHLGPTLGGIFAAKTGKQSTISTNQQAI